MIRANGIVEIVRRTYPMIDVELNPKTGRYEIYEEIFKDTVRTRRKLWDYENFDGSYRPIVADVVLHWLRRADTRRWPMQERVKLWDKEDKEELEAKEKQASEDLKSLVIEDYDHIAGIKTFFCNPAFNFTKQSHPFAKGIV